MAAAAATEDFFDTDRRPHGKVKCIMWFKYLQSFIAKTQQSESVAKTIICDVFAGPGVYDGNGWSTTFTDYGSPLVALRAAFGHFIWKNKLSNNFEPIDDAPPEYTEDQALMLEDYTIDLYFVEKKKRRYQSLVKNIILFFNFHGIDVLKSSQASAQACVASTDESFPIRCYIFNCQFVDFPVPDVPFNARMATFVDPFGFAMIPWENVSNFVGANKALFINLMTSFMHKCFKKTRDKLAEVFGTDLEVLETLRIEDKSHFVDTLVDLYVERLERSGIDYALTFEMRNIGNVRLYHLIFATSHIEGLKSMKESFIRGSQEQDTFILSDYKILRKNIPLNLKNQQDPEQVANAIFDEFSGRNKVSIRDIEMFVWLETPYVYRKKPLAILEKDGRIVNVVGKNGKIRNRRHTFPDGTVWLISFASAPLE